MTQQDIDLWLFDNALAFIWFGFPPIGVSIHRHEDGYTRETYDLEPAQ